MKSIKRTIINTPTLAYDLEYHLLTLVRTHQLWQQRLKKDTNDYVFICKNDLIVYNSVVEKLKNEGKLSVIVKQTSAGFNANYYKALVSGPVNFNHLKPKGITLSSLHLKMMNHLLEISIPKNVSTSTYFDAFMQYRNCNLRIFFIVDSFSHRVHTPVTSLSKEMRQKILIREEETASLDVCTMQPLILGKILETEIGDNEFSNLINSGRTFI